MRASRDDDDTPELPMMSLIDMVFLLLVFFLVATNFVRPEIDQQVQLPRAGLQGGDAAVPSALVINVRADGVWVVDGRVVDEGGLRDAIRDWRSVSASAAGGRPGRAAIRGDGRVSYEAVMRVMGLCRREGLVEVDLPVWESEGTDPL